MSPREWWRYYTDTGRVFAEKARDDSKPYAFRVACQRQSAMQYAKARGHRDFIAFMGRK